MVSFQPSTTLSLIRNNYNNSISSHERTKKKIFVPLVIGIIFLIVLLSTMILTASLYVKILHNSDPLITGIENKLTTTTTTSSTVKYHIVFSTGCSVCQDWQSYVFFYQAYAIQQGGTVTRIVSGCTTEQQVQLQTLFDEQIRTMVYDNNNNNNNNNIKQQYNDNFRIHFTPDYSKLKPKENYVYFNKPYGMKHWLENVIGFSSTVQNGRTIFNDNDVTNADKDSIIVLLDPDQIIMKKFENNNFSNTDWRIPDSRLPSRNTVSKGYPMGQLYGYGLQWKQKINMTTVLNAIPNNGGGRTTLIDTMSNEDARSGYIVGPPYVVIASDMYKIVVTWTQFVIPVHDQYPHLLAEMFAYSLASAHLLLHHQTAISFMVSDSNVEGRGEGWRYINDMPLSNICTSHRIVRPVHNRGKIQQEQEQLPIRSSNNDGPWVFHYCQRYSIGPYFFAKHRIKNQILTCQSPLFAEPATNVYEIYNYYVQPQSRPKIKFETNVTFTRDSDKKRSAYTLCFLLQFINDAATYYRQHHCLNGTANYNKSLYLAWT